MYTHDIQTNMRAQIMENIRIFKIKILMDIRQIVGNKFDENGKSMSYVKLLKDFMNYEMSMNVARDVHTTE